MNVKYHGIMDCHGVESFSKCGEGSHPGWYHLRAASNRQRHATYYVCELSVGILGYVNALLKEKKYKEACTVIKGMSKTLVVPTGYKDSVEMIPNDRLDPWWGGDDE